LNMKDKKKNFKGTKALTAFFFILGFLLIGDLIHSWLTGIAAAPAAHGSVSYQDNPIIFFVVFFFESVLAFVLFLVGIGIWVERRKKS